MVYLVNIQGQLDNSWSDWLGGARIQTERSFDGKLHTILTVDLPDQSALFGILDHIRDLNLELVGVIQKGEELCDSAGSGTGEE